MYLCAKRLNKLTVTEKNEKNGHKTKQIAKECIFNWIWNSTITYQLVSQRSGTKIRFWGDYILSASFDYVKL